jgi:murein DD-endopeptidase MepM/ murein hydrolase activator NlpD
MAKRSAAVTVMVVPSDGRAVRTISLPGWSGAALRLWVMAALWLTGVTGWRLQAQFGLQAPHVQLAALSDRSERWGAYERLGRTVEESKQIELRQRAAWVRALALGLGNRAAGSALWLGNVAPEWAQEAARGPIGNGWLLWPVREGAYGRGFGSGAAGYHLAVDIAGPRGADVLAAAPGVVGYASNELRGYGWLVMLVHPGGSVTLYGHNQRLLVVPGEHVRRGQPIAELGSTGHSMGPHVHFELINDGRNCDPVPLFREAELPGWITGAQSALWPAGQAKPKAVRCARRQDHPHPRHDLDEKLGPDDEGEPLASLTQPGAPLTVGSN